MVKGKTTATTKVCLLIEIHIHDVVIYYIIFYVICPLSPLSASKSIYIYFRLLRWE